MQFSTLLGITATLMASTGMAAPAALDAQDAVTTFPMPENPEFPDGYNATDGSMLIRRGDCDYYVKVFKKEHCKGGVYETNKEPNAKCYGFTFGHRNSFIINPVQSHCHHGHVQFFKSNNPSFCTGGVKFDSDFRGRTCMSPKSSHPYDSITIRNY